MLVKKYAAIDIGTNSMRLLLATVKNGKIMERKKYINTTRIGSSVDENKMISKEGIERNVEAFYDFTQKAREYGAEEIPAIATSAVRDAKNKEELIQAIYRRTGIKTKTITGEEEAELGYKGVIMGIGTQGDGSFASPCCVIDIGGGSTELIPGTRQGDVSTVWSGKHARQGDVSTVWSGKHARHEDVLPTLGNTGQIQEEGSTPKKIISLDIGAVRMTKKFITTDPINKKEYEKMETAICKAMEEARQEIISQIINNKTGQQCHPERNRTNSAHEGSRFSTLTAVGIGGTITSLAALHQKLDPYDSEKVHNYKLTLEDIDGLKEKLLSLTVRQIKQLRGIHPKRADIITAGVTILSVIMNSLNLKEIIVSEYDNLEGMLHCLFYH